MNELKRDSEEILATAADQTTVPASNYQDVNQGERVAGIMIGIYDELDYRLMATFPASDAVARY